MSQSLTQTPENSSDFESTQFSNGPTSRTTTTQLTRIMNFQEQVETLLKSAQQEKDNEIKRLTEENKKLKEEMEQLRQFKNIASEMKKILDGLSLDHPNRPMYSQPRHPPFPASVSLPSSNVDVSKSIVRPGPADEQSANGTNHHANRSVNYNNQEEFSTSQGFRSESDTDIINQAMDELPRQHYHPAHSVHNSSHQHNNLPTTSLLMGSNNLNSQKRFGGGFNGLGGTNNNSNNRNRSNHNNNKHTIFIAWTGSMTKDQLSELFATNNIDIVDIRYTSPKQFAHVDLKSQEALNNAMSLNGKSIKPEQGILRVEQGRPRNNNNNNNNNNNLTENGQRPQIQNKNNYNNRPNNKNSNGYTNSQKQKFIPNFNHSNQYHNNHNNNNHNYPSDEKENSNWSLPENKD